MAGPLDGIRAVEWAGYGATPLTGVMLGDLGADVIKIEQRAVGDPLRTSSHYRQHFSGLIPALENTNRSKRSLSLDLKKEKGKEIIYHLLKNTDVFHTNYGQSRAARVGLAYKTLSRVNTRLIYSDNTGYGPRGPDSEVRGFDPAAQARSALMYAVGYDDDPPTALVGAVVDATAGTVGVIGILAALSARNHTGVGQLVNSSLLGSAIWVQIFNIQTGLLRAGTREHLGERRPQRTERRSPFGNYKCSDGKWITIYATEFDEIWGRFCQIMGIREHEYTNLKNDDLQKGDITKRLTSVLEKCFATKPRDEWLNIFRQKSAPFAYAPVNEVQDLLPDLQVLENNYVVNFEHPTAGPVKLVGCPLEFSRTPAKIKSAAPQLGQHTEEVLLEIGYTRNDIAQLREAEVI